MSNFKYFCGFLWFSIVLFIVSEIRGLEDAFEPLGGPKVAKLVTLLIETYRNFAPSQTSGFSCQMHFFVVDTIHAIDSRSVEQYSAVKMSLDVSYWSGLLLG